MKLKNSSCDWTEKLKLQWNLKSQVAMKLKNSNCNEPKKNQILMKLKNWNCDKIQKLNLW